MNPQFAVEMLKALMVQAVSLAAPILFTAMIVGLLVSLFQSVTSIQEQTLGFVPKALAVVGLLILIMPWILRTLIEFASTMIQRMPQMVQ
jgi:flagellar biosynthesis protein FliQ